MLLCLDCSLSTGYAIFNGVKLVEFGLCLAKREGKQDHPNYPINFIHAADSIVRQIDRIIGDNPITRVVIEETNQMARDRYAQKQLEFIHYSLNKSLEKKNIERVYLSTSQWKKLLNIRLSKEQRAHNKMVKNGQAKGKVTNKHLTVNKMNKVYGLSLLMKDNDTADAIALGSALLTQEKLLPTNKWE
jgi:hypothetical protein